MQTAFTEMFDVVVPALVIQEGCKPFHIAVVLDEHQVYSRNIAIFFALSLHNDMVLFPSKHIDCKIQVLLLEFVNL